MQDKNGLSKKTMQIVWVAVELAAIGRSGIATYNVAMDVSKGDQAFAIFTTATIELAFLAMMFLIGFEAVAPVGAAIALLFSGVMQYVETMSFTGMLSDNDKSMLRVVVSFAPTAILLLALVKRLTQETDIVGNVASAIEKITPQKREEPKPQALPQPTLTMAASVEPVTATSNNHNGAHPNAPTPSA